MGKMDFTSVYEEFWEMLKKRFEEQKNLGDMYKIEEDTIRYFFFTAVVKKGGYEPSDFWLEGHFFAGKNFELDMLIKPAEDSCKESVAIEFKYNRLGNEKSDGTKTENAGKAFRDLNRLAQLGSLAQRRFFVYVMDGRMKDYFSSGKNLWSKSLKVSLPLEEENTAKISAKDVQELNGKCKSFYNSATDKGEFEFKHDFSVECVFSQPCDTDKYLCIYELA